MEEFFAKNRILLIVACVITFLYSIFELYRGIEFILTGNTGRGISVFVNSGIMLFVSFYLLTKVRGASNKFKEEGAAGDQNSKKGNKEL